MTSQMTSEIVEMKMFVGGAWVDGAAGATRESIDPFTAEAWARVPEASGEDVFGAVAAARKAFDDGPWPRMSGRDRARLLRRLASLIEVGADDLVEAEVRDNGKVIREVAGQIRSLPEYYEYYAGMADKLTGQVLPTFRPSQHVFELLEPIGVVAAIAAWNSPLLIATYKLAPALAAGCTVVLKPSEHTPVSTLRFAGLVEEAELPTGVLNVITGGGEAGGTLVAQSGIDKVAFTGSTPTGIRVAQAAAAHLAPVSLELGGKSPNIVFSDADLEAAANGVIAGIYAATGQTCVAGSRLLVQREIHDELVQRIVERARTIRLGNPMDYETEMGPLAFLAHRDYVLSRIHDAVGEGAQVAVGGQAPSGHAPGFFVEPTVLSGVTNGMRVAQEEIFGPVLSVIPFADEAEAIAIANDCPHGLAAGVWTRDIGRAHRVLKRLEVGTVWVNCYRLVSYDVPFGGRKLSGYGRENGPAGIQEYLVSKYGWIETSGETRDPFVLG